MTEVRSDGKLEDKSVGELVAIATASVSHLIKSELELAKLELKDDAKRAGLSTGLFAAAGVIACFGVILLSFFVAYLLMMWGVWDWLAFLIVAVAYFVLAGLLVIIGRLWMKKITGVNRTKSTVKQDLAMLRRGGEAEDKPALTG